jgi:hypothetical protein
MFHLEPSHRSFEESNDIITSGEKPRSGCTINFIYFGKNYFIHLFSHDYA